MQPVLLPANRPPDRFYLGGPQIAAFRGESTAPRAEPEDWVGSVTSLAGDPELGRTRLPDGELLADAVARDPIGWLGDQHVARYGADPMLLVKLLDAGQRLPVHAHPDRAFAAAQLARAHGKTEAWYILTGGRVHLGLTRDVAAADLADLVSRQDTDAMLALLHARDVSAGDVVLVPAGVLHAVGAGVFLLELQEPEDLSILLEWRGFDLDGERDGHLGLGFPVALGAVETRGRSAAEIDALFESSTDGATVLPEGSEPYFRLEHRRIDGDLTTSPGFAVVVVADGEVTLDGHQPLRLTHGSTAVVPHGAGALHLIGHGDVLICRPPSA